MKKRFTILIAALMLLTMITQPTRLWGQSVTLNFTSNTWSLPTDYTTGTVNYTDSGTGKTITMYAASNGWKFYGTAPDGANLFGKNGSYLQLPAFDFPVKKIVVVGKSGASGKVTQNIFVGTTAVSTSTTGATGTYTYNINSSYQAAGNEYRLKVTNANNTQVTQIKVYRACTVTYNANGGSGTMTDSNSPYAEGDEVTLKSNTFTAPSGYTFNGWLVKDASNNTITVTNNKFTMPASNVTVTAQWSSSGDYITVSPTTATPTCAAQNVVFDITTDQELDANPIVFYTNDAGTTPLGSTPGWIGSLTSAYNSGTGKLTVPVFANTGAARTAYFRVEKNDVKSDVVTINQAVYSPAAPTLPATGNFDYTKEITITVPSGTTVYYTTDGNNPTSSSTAYSAPFTINATKTVKAVAYDNGYPSSVVSATYTRTYDYISSISSTSTYYTVKGTVVATNTKGFVFGDATGYIYDYYATSIPSVGSVVSITNQKVSTYGKVYEFKAASSSDSGSAYTSDTPTIIDGDDMYTVMNGSTNYISNYQQFVGTLTKSGSNYFFEVAGSSHTSNAMISYPTTAQSGDLDDLDGEIVKVNGYFTGVATVSSTSYYSVMLESVEACPLVTTSVSAISNFTYNYGGGPDTKNFTVTGANLTNDITISTNSANFEISSNNSNWQTSDITISKGSGTVAATTIYVRLKSGLSSNTYSGKITVSSDGADDKEVALTGTVTHVIAYNTSLPTGCSVSSEPNGAQVAGQSVSVSATAGSGYKFSAWDVYKTGESLTKVTVTDNAFTMPDYGVTVSATFVPAYTVTYDANGGSGEMSDPDSPYASGATVTVLNNNSFTRDGYDFSRWDTESTGDGTPYNPAQTFSISSNTTLYAQWTRASYDVTLSSVNDVTLSGTYGTEGTIAETDTKSIPYGTEITLSATNMTAGKVFIWNVKKQSDNSDVTDDVLDGDVLTVPAYAITIGGQVATLYVKTSGTLVEGDYVVTYGVYAMKNTISSNRLTYSEVSISDNIILNPETSIIWHIEPSATSGYWTIYNASVEKYAASTGVASKAQLLESGTDDCSLWAVSGTSTYDFTNKKNTDNAVNAILRNNGTYGFACYANGTGGALSLFKQVTGSKHSITISDGITNGSVETNLSSAYEGQAITLTATPIDGYMFDSWDVYKTVDASTKVTVKGNSFTMPGYDVTVSATFRVQHTYTLVDGSTVKLEAGKHYIIASSKEDGDAYAIGAQGDNNRTAIPVEVSSSSIGEVNGLYEFVISGDNTNKWTIYDVINSGYLYAAGSGSGKNYLKCQSLNDNNGVWEISFSSSVATITAQGSNTNNLLKKNNSSNIFSCYSSGQNAVYIYKRDGDKDLEFHSPTTLESLTIANNETYTVESGQVLEVTGTLTNNGTAANLVIEDGGVLITKSTGVKATVKKNVTKSTNWGTGSSYTPDGWYFIASPVNGAAFPTGSVADQDIFQLDWANNKWLNLQISDNSLLHYAGFQRGTGYLYASKAGNTVSVAGEIQPLSNSDNATITLTKAGWNLIGNPLTCKVTVDCAFSELVNGSAVTNKDANSVINPCQGIAVYSTAGNETITFTKAESQAAAAPSNNNSLQMTLAKKVTSRGETSTKVIDNAIVSFNESKGMPKFNMLSGSAKLYIPQNDEEYSVVFSDKQGDLPLNFKANETGTYTISFETNDRASLQGIYLIDILAEEEIDLSVNPTYTFIGSPADRTARFKIVFRPSTSSGTDIFAYQNGNDIVVTGEGELQIFDVMGRVVMHKHVNGIETINVKSQGVYIFRLNEKSQKIVVR